ncbi:MAG: hypothetical protein NT046_01385 [Arenimonas sp.]|nr:hypothetical protein [Arenimonas sp.]
MKLLMVGAMALLLVACSGGSPPAGKGRASARPDVATQVAAVRAAGVNGNELEVQPLRDPQVEDLRVQAEAQEARRELKKANATLDRALVLSPGDPDLLQWKAELALLGRAWVAAEQLANDSFQKGPKLGGLCRRNWTTIAYARQGRGDAAGATVARGQVASCTVAPPVRM